MAKGPWSPLVVALVAASSCSSGTGLGDGGTGGQVTRDPQCPATLPAMGATCNATVTCDYGADAKHACATNASCNGTTWFVSPPAAGCGTHPSPCPTAFGFILEGGACFPVVTGACDYDEGRCECLPCFSNGVISGQTWSCRRWDSGGTSCPAPAPLAGTSCATPDQFCYYGNFCSVGVGANFKCTGGYWRSEPGPAGSCAERQCAAAAM